MAEIAEPPPTGPMVDIKTGYVTDVWRRWLEGRAVQTQTDVGSIISGQAALQAAQEQAEANAQQQAASNAAAAQAAIAASGSTETDQDDFGSAVINSGTYATFATCNLNHAGGGNYTITSEMSVTALTSDPLISSGFTFNGEWRIIENPGTNVLFAGGAFTVTSAFNNGFDGPFYTHEISFAVALPTEDAVADAGSGAVTVELQLRRASGSNDVSGLFGSQLVQWA